MNLKDNYGEVRNEQALLIAKSGWGKGLAIEGLIEEYYKAGYVIICIADPKDELEFCYQMFEPIKSYHLDHLKKIGKRPEKKNVKVYHPFTFNIPPNKLLPEINFYTISLKDLGEAEFSFLAETNTQTEAIKILSKASQDISKEDGIYSILHYAQRLITGKREEKIRKSDPRNFYLRSSSGTMKSLTEVSNYFHAFKRHYFLCRDNSPLKLNFKEILNDQKNYHVFVSDMLSKKLDGKLKQFLILYLLNSIVANKSFLNKPLLIVIPEISELCPLKCEGYKKFLSEKIKDSLKVLRSSGRGMSSILDSQNYTDIDEGIKNATNITFFGELGSGSDMERVSKAFNYKRDIRDQLKKMDYPNSWLLVGEENRGAFTLFFPSSRHAEPKYNFYETYKEEYPEKMKTYNDIIDLMKNDLKNEEDKIKNKVKLEEKKEREIEERKRKEREELEEKSDVDVNKDKKIKQLKDENKLEKMKRCWEFRQENPGLSLRESAKKLGFPESSGNKTFKKYIEMYSEKVRQDDENSNGKVLEDL